jgi:hypothetical protein
MLLAEVHDLVWQALIAGCVTIVLALINRSGTRQVVATVDKASTKATQSSSQVANTISYTAKEAAGKVAEVKETLIDSTQDTGDKLAGLLKIGEATHSLVNSNFGVQLEIGAIALERVAEYSKKPEDMEVAKMARKRFEEHAAKQKAVDAADMVEVKRDGTTANYTSKTEKHDA